jgi:hypothetical protein
MFIKMRFVFYVSFLFLVREQLYADAKRPLSKALDSLIGEYKRSCTLVELTGESFFHSFFYGNDSRVVTVLIPARNGQEVKKEVVKRGYENTVVLAPSFIDTALIKRFGRCEFPDIVIAHGLAALDSCSESFLKALLTIGDFVCIEGNALMVQKIIAEAKKEVYASEIAGTNSYCIFKTPKYGLDIARWNLNSKPEAVEPRYKVVSTFEKKQLIKGSQVTDYIPGINLLTCVMLNGIYPTDELIRQNIKPLSGLQHEDLVIGNFVVQGKRLIPIDFNDKRRRGDAARCVKAALYFFKKERRFGDVRKALQSYEKRVQKKKKR